MDMLIPVTLACPYCGESVDLLVDGSVAEQRYIEDCSVCCCPIELSVAVDERGEARVSGHAGDEA
jgi:hypothetical protein